MAKKSKRERSWLDEHGITNQNQRLFLTALAVTGNPTRAAAAAGVSRKSHYNWLDDQGPVGDAYRAATKDAKERACEFLEGEAWDWATKGIKVPKWHNGKRVGYDLEKSLVLLIFLMKGAMPDKYRDNVNVQAALKGQLTLEQIVAQSWKPVLVAPAEGPKPEASAG